MSCSAERWAADRFRLIERHVRHSEARFVGSVVKNASSIWAWVGPKVIILLKEQGTEKVQVELQLRMSMLVAISMRVIGFASLFLGTVMILWAGSHSLVDDNIVALSATLAFLLCASLAFIVGLVYSYYIELRLWSSLQTALGCALSTRTLGTGSGSSGNPKETAIVASLQSSHTIKALLLVLIGIPIPFVIALWVGSMTRTTLGYWDSKFRISKTRLLYSPVSWTYDWMCLSFSAFGFLVILRDATVVLSKIGGLNTGSVVNFLLYTVLSPSFYPFADSERLAALPDYVSIAAILRDGASDLPWWILILGFFGLMAIGVWMGLQRFASVQRASERTNDSYLRSGDSDLPSWLVWLVYLGHLVGWLATLGIVVVVLTCLVLPRIAADLAVCAPFMDIAAVAPLPAWFAAGIVLISFGLAAAPTVWAVVDRAWKNRNLISSCEGPDNDLAIWMERAVKDMGIRCEVKLVVSSMAGERSFAYVRLYGVYRTKAMVVLWHRLVDETVMPREWLKALVIHELAHVKHDLWKLRLLSAFSVIAGVGRAYLTLGLYARQAENMADDCTVKMLGSSEALIAAIQRSAVLQGLLSSEPSRRRSLVFEALAGMRNIFGSDTLASGHQNTEERLARLRWSDSQVSNAIR